MSTAPLSILQTCYDWCDTHIATKYPALQQGDIAAIYHAPALVTVQRALDAACATGDIPALQTVAHQWCAAWRDALKHAIPLPRPPFRPAAPPTVAESPYRRYASSLLEEELVLCPTREDATTLMAQGTVAYIAEELELLQEHKAHDGLHFPDTLRAIHTTKKVFGGFVEPAPSVMLKGSPDASC